MNQYLPEWNIEPDLHVPSSQRKPPRPDEELVELLWKNGHVVLNNQTHRNQIQDPNESKKITKHNQETPQNLAQENELLSWIHHCQVDDPFEKELSSFLLPEFIPNISSNSSLIHHSPFDTSQISHILPYTSKNHCPNSSQTPQIQAQTHEKRCPDTDTDTDTNNNNNNNHSPTSNGDGFKENSGKTIGRSHCGSNQVIYEDDFADKVDAFQSERTNERETITGSLSSGGSGFTTWNQYSTGTNSSKRKSRETENSESLSEAALLESGTRKKNAQEFVTTTRKSRASEVHNLSERRRRDRINEKMRALQELLPRSNQTDKASMLDEAIQYMKSLQLQLQMMWMGSQMAPMVFPQYMSRLEMGISPQMIPNLQSGMNLSRLPMMDQARANQANLLNCINYQNQMQNYNFSEQYGPYVGGRFYPSVRSANNQQMNMFSSYGPNTAQPPNQTLPPPGDGNIGPPA